jgi:hypothetical protein
MKRALSWRQWRWYLADLEVSRRSIADMACGEERREGESGCVPEKSTRTVSRERKNSPSGTRDERSLRVRDARTPALRANVTRCCIARSCLMEMERRVWRPSACQGLALMSLRQRGHMTGRE